MKVCLLTTILLWFAVAESDGSSEESKYKYFSEEGITAIARNSQVIIRGKVIEHVKTHYFKGKEVSLEEGRKLASNSDEGLVVEVAATIQIEKVLKGPVAGEKVTFKWRDPARTDCPHIPMRPPFLDGIWFTFNELERPGATHQVDWAPLGIQEELIVAIEKWEAEADSDGSAEVQGTKSQ